MTKHYLYISGKMPITGGPFQLSSCGLQYLDATDPELTTSLRLTTCVDCLRMENQRALREDGWLEGAYEDAQNGGL